MKDRRGAHIKVGSGGWRLATALQEGIVHSPMGMNMNVCVGRGAELLRVSLWGLHSSSVMYFMAPSSSDRSLRSAHCLLCACCTDEGSHTLRPAQNNVLPQANHQNCSDEAFEPVRQPAADCVA